jgi:DNA replicative helicase MCM subunit Mcm2 (Cdc46/Mcm family)
VHDRCEIVCGRVIRLQEIPAGAVPDCQMPHTMSLSMYDKLVVVRKPGGRFVITGIYHSVPVRMNPRRSADRLIQNLLTSMSVTSDPTREAPVLRPKMRF